MRIGSDQLAIFSVPLIGTIERRVSMRDYLKATLIVIGALMLIGLFTLLWPLTKAIFYVTWPILLVIAAIIAVAQFIRWKRNN